MLRRDPPSPSIPTSFLKLNTGRNVEFGVILCREKCSYGQAAPNAFLAFQENPRRIGFACMFWGHLHARVIALNFLYAYIKSRHCGMRCDILSRGGNYFFILNFSFGLSFGWLWPKSL